MFSCFKPKYSKSGSEIIIERDPVIANTIIIIINWLNELIFQFCFAFSKNFTSLDTSQSYLINYVIFLNVVIFKLNI